jgi:hypothetical protein
MSINFFRYNGISPVFGKSPLDSEYMYPTAFDEFGALKHLLTTKHSLLNPTRAETSKDELDLFFSVGNESLKPAALSVVLVWVLAASAWRLNLEQLDRRLDRLRTIAMSNPSLATFKPIPLLRQYVAEVQDALREIKDGIGEKDNQALAQLQSLAQSRLETLDSIFDTLLKQTGALSSKASNEIQLVIGSVTIQVMTPISQLHPPPSNAAQDSDMMKRQSRRATVFTLLAAFYLPLSLVTGIFGMNIKEFDDVKPSFVLCFEALFAVIAVTMIFYGLYRYLPLVYNSLRAPMSASFRKHRPAPSRSLYWLYHVYEIMSSLEKWGNRRLDDLDLESGYDKED